MKAKRVLLAVLLGFAGLVITTLVTEVPKEVKNIRENEEKSLMYLSMGLQRLQTLEGAESVDQEELLQTMRCFDRALAYTLSDEKKALCHNSRSCVYALMAGFSTNDPGDRTAEEYLQLALAVNDTGLIFNPTSTDLWAMRGGLFWQLGLLEEARRAADSALKYGPGNPAALLMRDSLAARLGEAN